MIHHLGSQNSIFNTFISELRDVNIQKDSLRFRRNMQRIGEIFAYEISKEMDYQTTLIETPLGSKAMELQAQEPVIASILRAGVPLHEGVLSFFDKASSAFISAYRKHDETGAFSIRLGYVSCPNLDGKTLILCDPMLATGSSMELCYNSFLEHGTPAHTHIVSVIAAQDGIDYLQKRLGSKDYTLWVGAIDEELTSQSYIVPGLGDAGDLAYGVKIQE